MGDFAGQHAIVRKGMPLVADRLLERADCDVVLNCELKALVEDDDGVQLLCSVEGGTHSIRAEWVVCTASLGALKRGSIAITPMLPARLQNAVHVLQMSHYCKCILLLSDEVVCDMPVWTYTDHLLFPMAFCYFPLKGSPLVACTSISSSLIHMDDAETVAEAVAALKIENSTVKASHVTRWTSDRSGGAYSYSPTESDFTEVDEFLAIKLDRRLFFGGEHTHDEYQGSVHGAYLSGREVAEAVAARATETSCSVP